MLPPPTMQSSPRKIPNLERMKDYTREKVIGKMTRLNTPYSHATQMYKMKNLILNHYNKPTTLNPLIIFAGNLSDSNGESNGTIYYIHGIDNTMLGLN